MSGTARNVEDDAVRAFHGGLEQRRRDGFLRRVGGAVLAAPLADAHHRRARIAHDRLDVGKIQIDEPGLGDEVADARDSLAQYVVGVGERFVERRLLFDDLQDAFVRNGDQRVDLSLELGDSVLRDLHAFLYPRTRTAS